MKVKIYIKAAGMNTFCHIMDTPHIGNGRHTFSFEGLMVPGLVGRQTMVLQNAQRTLPVIAVGHDTRIEVSNNPDSRVIICGEDVNYLF